MNNANIRESLNKISNTFAEQPDKALTRTSPLTAKLTGGLRCEVRGPNAEMMHTDMPATLGGGASAPTPGWYLRAAVASCTATVIAMHAARLGIALSTLEVSVESRADQRGLLGLDGVAAGVSTLHTRVRIGSPGVDADELRTLVAWGDAHSPVACTVRSAPVCSIDVEIV
jgi:uncharacterized OsmC-like protein